jgi:hypothetical protein
MIKVFSPLDQDYEFTRNNVEYVLKANAETELPLVAATHAVRTLGHLGVMQLKHPNDVALAESKLKDQLRVWAGHAFEQATTVNASPQAQAELKRHEDALERIATRPKARIELEAEPEVEKSSKKKSSKKTEAQPAPEEE